MKLRLEATPDELRDKSGKLLKALSRIIAPANPELADFLEKALPHKEPELKYPVLRELQKITQALYDKQMKTMVADIGKVLDRSVQKSLEDEHDMENFLEKGDKPVIARGPRGGGITGYDSKGNPIYGGKEKEKPTWKITKVVDLRPIDWNSGKKMEIPYDEQPECDRCGKRHQVVYEMKASDGQFASVGSGCGPKLAGGADFIDKKSLKAAKKKQKEEDELKAEAQLTEWTDVVFAKVNTVQPPPLTVTPVSGKADIIGEIPMPTGPGLMTSTGTFEQYKWVETADFLRTFVSQYADEIVRQVMKDSDIPSKWPFKAGGAMPKFKVGNRVAWKLVQKWKAESKEVDALYKSEFKDHTKMIADKDDIAYTRVKQVLVRMGYTDTDFDEGGPLYGWSVNELLDLARNKRLA